MKDAKKFLNLPNQKNTYNIMVQSISITVSIYVCVLSLFNRVQGCVTLWTVSYTGRQVLYHLHHPGSPFIVHLPSCVKLFSNPWTAAHQASLSFTISWSLLRFMSIELVMPSNHLILCHPLLLWAGAEAHIYISISKIFIYKTEIEL